MKETRYVLPNVITGAEIQSLRKYLNLTQAAFADFVHVSKSTIERWESGKENISGAMVPLIHNADLRPQPKIK